MYLEFRSGIFIKVTMIVNNHN